MWLPASVFGEIWVHSLRARAGTFVPSPECGQGLVARPDRARPAFRATLEPRMASRHPCKSLDRGMGTYLRARR